MIKFKSLLKTTNLGQESFWHKAAQVQPDETQFEQDFSKLAFMFVQDRAAPLMPYLLGFETVDRSDDGSRAVGIFGFKLGEDYYYIPAFFLNNQVKGMDILFKKKSNTFMPLTEDWVNYILNRQTIELGDAAQNGDKLQSDFDAPNFDFLQHPRVGPLGYHDKHAEADLFIGSTSDEGWPLGVAWEAMKKAAELGIQYDDKFMESWTGFVRAYQHKPQEKSASSEIISDYLKNVGGPEASITLLKSFGMNGVKVANAVFSLYKNLDAFRCSEYATDCYQIKRANERRPKTYIKIAQEAEDEESARELIEQGFVIKDKRPDGAKSEVYELDFDKDFSNPTAAGIYQVLLADNKFEKAYVLNSIDKDGGLFVYFPEANTAEQAAPDKVIVLGSPEGTVSDIYDKANALSSISVGRNKEDEWNHPDHRYLLIDEAGHTAGTFNAYSIVKEDGKRTIIKGSGNLNSCCGCCCDECFGGGNTDDDFENFYRHDRFHDINGYQYHSDPSYYSNLELADHKGMAKIRGNTLIVPSNWKVLPVTNTDIKELGSSLSITENLIKNAFHKLRIDSDGESYHISLDRGFPGRPLNLKQASIKLVTELGIDSHKASRILKHAGADGKAECYVKYAQFVGVGMPQPPPEAGGIDPYTGMPMYQMPYEAQQMGQMNGVPALPDPDQQGFNIGSNNQITSGQEGPGMPGAPGDGVPQLDEESMGLAQQASELGQKTVFDHAAIGGLAKVYDTSAVIDSYLPEFMQTIDRLGRLIFLYYWKHEDFTSRYGTSDTVEIEDIMRGTFKQLGDLTLKLKQKTIGPEDADTVTA